ncbi:MAG: carboxypeptidase-like regulatory domain-containing protein, partial [Blastocatellia bacterium]
SGAVADEKGAVVADAGITVTNSSTGIARQTKTGDDGGFKVLLLPPGTYSVAAQRQGFSPYAGKVPGAFGGATITRLQSLRPYPYYSSIGVRVPHLGNSIYHALLLSVEKRLNKGFVLLASYTKSKLMSDTTRPAIDFAGVEQVTVFGYQNGKFNRRAERSPDPTDVADRLVVSGVYELPFGRGKLIDGGSGFVNGLIGGWQLNMITTIQSGLPLVVRGANNFVADRPNLVGDAKLDNPTARKWFNTDAVRLSWRQPDHRDGQSDVHLSRHQRTTSDSRGRG